MPNEYNINQAIEVGLLALVIGRESRGGTYDEMLGVGWSIRNRVGRPAWWGHDWISVITHPEQYSSIYPPHKDADPNLWVYPTFDSKAWSLVIQAAEAVYWANEPDNTNGADSYYDHSLDVDPPEWAKEEDHVKDIGTLHFFKTI